MKKLKLDLDALRVETFEAERAPEPRGTVQANYTSGPIECLEGCVGADTNLDCASVHCSAWECNSLSGCVSYEVLNCSADC